MTTYYVDSVAGSNTAPYDTWAKAATALATIAAIDAAGDTVYVASTHNETSAVNLLYSWAGTLTSPTRVIFADKTSGGPPATLATGGAITTTGAHSITPGVAYFYGLTFNCGTGVVSADIKITNGVIFESCTFKLLSTGPSGQSTVNISGNSSLAQFINCSFTFSATDQGFGHNDGVSSAFIGGGLAVGTSTPTNLFGLPNAVFSAFANINMTDFDLSNAAATINITNTTARIVMTRCKLPTSWSGSATAIGNAQSIILDACDYSGTNNSMRYRSIAGSIDSETTLIRSGGASDGVTGLSWKITSVAASGTFPIVPLESRPFVLWNDTTGAAKTLTVEFLHDSVTGLKDNELVLEVDYFGASGSPLGTRATSAPSAIAAGSTLSSSSASWTTTGMTNPNKQNVSVTFTPQLKGLYTARLKLFKASYTVYGDPKITVT